MIPTSADYKRQLISGNRNYVIKAETFLAGNTSGTPDFTLTNEHIWDNGIVIDEAISSNSSFDIGAAIVGSLKIVIDNIHGNFSQYDFLNAKITLWMGVEGDEDSGVQRYYRKGFYVVDEPTYNGSLITLNCLDNMTWFDVPFSEVTIGTGADKTAQQLMVAICSHVGVSLANSQFPYYTTNIKKEAIKELKASDINCREVVQYVAQKCCCYCKIDTAGKLLLKWYNKNDIIGLTDWDGGTYNTNTTPYSDGDNVEGGRWYWNGDTYIWTPGDSADGGTFEQLQNNVWLSQNYEMNVSTDDIVVTGVRLVSNNGDDDTHYDVTWVNSVTEQTHDRYVLVIENNPLIDVSEANTLAALIGDLLSNLPIRAFTARSLSDFSYETGDMVTIIDFRGNSYHTWITGFTFTTNNSESFYCGAQSVRERNESRFSNVLQTLAEAQKYASTKLSDYDAAVKEMDELAQNAIGFNEYVYESANVKIMYRYDGTAFSPSGANPKFPNANNVFKITGDGVYVARKSHGDIDADGTCHYSNGYDANSGTAILDLIYAQGISCDWVRSGTLALGGSTQGQYKNGSIYMYNSSDEEIGHWNRTGISVKTGTITLGNKTAYTDEYNGVYIGQVGISLGPNNTFKVGNTGTVICSNITVNGGSIKLTKQSFSDTNNGVYLGSDGISLGANDGTSNAFSVSNDGTLTATKGTFSGTLSGARGSIVDDKGTVYMRGGNLHIYNAEAGGAGVFAEKTGTAYESCWGAVNSSAQDSNSSGGYISTSTKNIVEAGVNVSDKRLKKNIKNIKSDFAKDLILGIKPKMFHYKAKKGLPAELQFGVIAQEVQEIEQKHGITEENRLCYEDKDGYLSVQYKQLIAPMIKVIQEQQKEIDLLKKDLAELKERVK